MSWWVCRLPWEDWEELHMGCFPFFGEVGSFLSLLPEGLELTVGQLMPSCLMLDAAFWLPGVASASVPIAPAQLALCSPLSAAVTWVSWPTGRSWPCTIGPSSISASLTPGQVFLKEVSASE